MKIDRLVYKSAIRRLKKTYNLRDKLKADYEKYAEIVKYEYDNTLSDYCCEIQKVKGSYFDDDELNRRLKLNIEYTTNKLLAEKYKSAMELVQRDITTVIDSIIEEQDE